MASATLLKFFRPRPQVADWTQRELAEFYFVESTLLQAGLVVTTDRGISDEGDPWFVFCRADNGEVIAHFARIDGDYVVVSSVNSGMGRGRDFRALVRTMLETHPLIVSRTRQQGQQLFLHPAALLTALLASAYFFSNEKELLGPAAASDANTKSTLLGSLFSQKFAFLAAATLGAVWVEHQAHNWVEWIQGSSPTQIAAHSGGDGAFDPNGFSVPSTTADAELGMHRSDLANQVSKLGMLAQEQTSQTYLSASSAPHAGTVQAKDDAHPSSWAGAAVTADHSNASPSDPAAAVLAAPRPAMNERLAEIDLRPASQLDVLSLLRPDHAQSSSSFAPNAAAHDAFELITSVVSNSVQPLLLSGDAISLNSALQLSMSQVGLNANFVSQNAAFSAAITIAADGPVALDSKGFGAHSPSDAETDLLAVSSATTPGVLPRARIATPRDRQPFPLASSLITPQPRRRSARRHRQALSSSLLRPLPRRRRIQRQLHR